MQVDGSVLDGQAPVAKNLGRFRRLLDVVHEVCQGFHSLGRGESRVFRYAFHDGVIVAHLVGEAGHVAKLGYETNEAVFFLALAGNFHGLLVQQQGLLRVLYREPVLGFVVGHVRYLLAAVCVKCVFWRGVPEDVVYSVVFVVVPAGQQSST